MAQHFGQRFAAHHPLWPLIDDEFTALAVGGNLLGDDEIRVLVSGAVDREQSLPWQAVDGVVSPMPRRDLIRIDLKQGAQLPPVERYWPPPLAPPSAQAVFNSVEVSGLEGLLLAVPIVLQRNHVVHGAVRASVFGALFRGAVRVSRAPVHPGFPLLSLHSFATTLRMGALAVSC